MTPETTGSATAVIGFVMFREHFTPAAVLGVAGVVLSGVLITWAENGLPVVGAGFLVTAGCVRWALDNPLTALIDGLTPSRTTLWKGSVAGIANSAIGLAVAPLNASASFIIAAVVVGALCYGASIVLYITAAQQLGATCAQSVFANAPFIGAALSLLALGEPLTGTQLAAGVILLASILVITRSAHDHPHDQETLEHIHSHRHDDGRHDHEYRVSRRRHDTPTRTDTNALATPTHTGPICTTVTSTEKWSTAELWNPRRGTGDAQLVRLQNWTGMTMFHCHIVEHEDFGIMAG